MTDTIIVDASPLIVMIKSGLDQLIPKVFAKVIVSTGVFDEVMAGPATDAARLALPGLSWISLTQCSEIPDSIKRCELGQGEAESLALSFGFPHPLVLVDDAAGRRCAELNHIRFLGTGGLLVLAAKRHLVDRPGAWCRAVDR